MTKILLTSLLLLSALALGDLPGYAADRAGEVLSLTRALPWWHFRHIKTKAT